MNVSLELVFFVIGILPYWYTLYLPEKNTRYWYVLIWCCVVWLIYFSWHGAYTAAFNNSVELLIALTGLIKMVDSSERARNIASTYEKNTKNYTLINCPKCTSMIDIEYYDKCGVCNTDLSTYEPTEVLKPVESKNLALDTLIADINKNTSHVLLENGSIEVLFWDEKLPELLLYTITYTPSGDKIRTNYNAPSV